MILVCFVKVPTDACADRLLSAVRRAFGKKNEQYIAQIESKKSEQGKIEGLAALLCLKALLDELNIGESALTHLKLARNENGKPYFENSTLQFNLSHSHGYVACALSDEGEIGIDVEASELTDERATRLTKRYFGAYNAPCDAKAFAHEWTKKEAETKLYGGRLGEYLKGEKSNEHICAEKNNVFFSSFEIDGYPIALCTKKTPSQIKQIDVKLDF